MTPSALVIAACIKVNLAAGIEIDPEKISNKPTSKLLIEALIDSDREVNIMQSRFVKKLGLCIQKIDVDAQKIDGSRLETFVMVIAFFLVNDKNKKF